MDDITAILDALGFERATIFGVAESANVCSLFAATYPERCERLVLWAPYARAVCSDEYPYGQSEDEWMTSLRDVRERWGQRDLLAEWAQFLDPAIAEDAELFELRLDAPSLRQSRGCGRLPAHADGNRSERRARRYSCADARSLP